MTNPVAGEPRYFRLSMPMRVLVLAGLLLLAWSFRNGLIDLYTRWTTREEYGHGFLLPFVALYFLWQDRVRIEEKMPEWPQRAQAVKAVFRALAG